jgi:molybdate transport system substrate-binding protein
VRLSARLSLFQAGAGLVALVLLAGCAKRPPAPRAEIVVAAAASLRGVLPELASTYERSHPGQRVTLSFGASGGLRQDVVAGAPIDLVVFAGGAPVDDLIGRGLVVPSSRKTIASNTLVLVGPKGATKKLTFATLVAAGDDEKVAVGDPRSVPAGQYAKAALEELHEWDALAGRLVYGSDVSAVLAYARRGEVVAAIVYKTELHGVPDVDVLDELREGLGPRPEVVVGVVEGSRVRREAEGLAAYIEGPEARAALVGYGFGPP